MSSLLKFIGITLNDSLIVIISLTRSQLILLLMMSPYRSSHPPPLSFPAVSPSASASKQGEEQRKGRKGQGGGARRLGVAVGGAEDKGGVVVIRV